MHRAEESLPMCVSVESELDELLEGLAAARKESGWLTLSFDDGYRDSAEYIRSRAPKYPGVQFLLFVCPEKTKRGVGFRWDAWEKLRSAGKVAGTLDQFLESDRHIDTENSRADLIDVGKDPRFALASVEECRALQQLPNVALGNHTDTHFKLSEISSTDARTEIERSHAHFVEMFGASEHFAFPYGTPGESYRPEHSAQVRALGYTKIWSTVGRTFSDDASRAGELPRFAVHGDWTLQDTFAWIAKASLKARVTA